MIGLHCRCGGRALLKANQKSLYSSANWTGAWLGARPQCITARARRRTWSNYTSRQPSTTRSLHHKLAQRFNNQLQKKYKRRLCGCAQLTLISIPGKLILVSLRMCLMSSKCLMKHKYYVTGRMASTFKSFNQCPISQTGSEV